MKSMNCKACGAAGLKVQGGWLVCEYCDSKFMLSSEDFDFYGGKGPNTGTGISLGGDIERLLQKCRTDPRNARKYANLVLDMDPDNEEARKYLR